VFGDTGAGPATCIRFLFFFFLPFPFPIHAINPPLASSPSSSFIFFSSSPPHDRTLYEHPPRSPTPPGHRERSGTTWVLFPLPRTSFPRLDCAWSLSHALQSDEERLGWTNLSGIDLVWRTTAGKREPLPRLTNTVSAASCNA